MEQTADHPLRDAISDTGLSEREFVTQANISRETLRRIFNGHPCTVRTAKKVRDALNRVAKSKFDLEQLGLV